MNPEHQRCDSCKLPLPQCVCSQVCRVPCGVEVLVVRHTLEKHRASNTGRLVGRCLQGAQVLDYADREVPFDAKALEGEDTWILYPQAGALPSSPNPPKRIIALDATWPQARKMMRKIPGLRGLPRLALPCPKEALPRMRRTSSPEQMSTAESVVCALRSLGETSAADHLEAHLREVVRRFTLPMRRNY